MPTTVISTSVDPRRERRLVEELDRAVRHSTHAPASPHGNRPARRRPASSVLPVTGKRFLDLLELAQRGLVENKLTDAGHRYHRPAEGNLEQLPPGDYVVAYLRVVTTPTPAGLASWRLGPCRRCGTGLTRNGRGEALHVDHMHRAHDHAAEPSTACD